MKGTIWNSPAAARQAPGGDCARLSKLHVRFIGALTGGRYSRLMRALLLTATTCLLLSPLGSDAAAPQGTPATAAPTAPASAPPAAAATTPATAADNEAAAKHAKRTACRKKARAKKLVGDEKTTFIKDCTAAP
jgi:hypothetical protein